jgi:hypothetical protein
LYPRIPAGNREKEKPYDTQTYENSICHGRSFRMSIIGVWQLLLKARASIFQAILRRLANHFHRDKNTDAPQSGH